MSPTTEQDWADNELLMNPAVVGFGITGQAVARYLVKRGITPLVIDDSPSGDAQRAAAELGLEIVVAPSPAAFDLLVGECSVVFPAPGLPDHHRLFALEDGPAIWSEFDLAGLVDDRPIVAITGTNGKTTVTLLVVDALERSGITAVGVGNTEVPLISAVSDRSIDVFVVEASSFRLAHSISFKPQVAAWLNFAPDHLDAHSSLDAYREAKASVFSRQDASDLAVLNIEDEVVWGAKPLLPRTLSFGLTSGDWRIEDGHLRGPDGDLVGVSELSRRQPHDLINAAAVAAIASSVGATSEGVRSALVNFSGFAHRVQLVGEYGGVSWYNDSKATVPHATAAAVGGFESVILIAGGKNKGLDLSPMGEFADRLKLVVTTGDAGPELAKVFADLVPTKAASSMSEAVSIAESESESGDVVLLSPGCTSFDWYKSYSERGNDFMSIVSQTITDNDKGE